MVTIFCDGASLADFERYADDPLVEGFTTNPSLLRKEGITRYTDFAKAVLDRCGGKPVSFEVLSDNPDEMEQQALTIASWGDNVYVKIPITFTDGVTTVRLINRIWKQRVKVNVTAIMTVDQLAMLYFQHGIPGKLPMILSVFAGRIADTQRDPKLVFNSARVRFKKLPNVKYLWASTRQVSDIVQAEQCGADIITMPASMIEKMALKGKDLTEYSKETVQQFHNDGKGIAL